MEPMEEIYKRLKNEYPKFTRQYEDFANENTMIFKYRKILKRCDDNNNFVELRRNTRVKPSDELVVVLEDGRDGKFIPFQSNDNMVSGYHIDDDFIDTLYFHYSTKTVFIARRMLKNVEEENAKPKSKSKSKSKVKEVIDNEVNERNNVRNNVSETDEWTKDELQEKIGGINELLGQVKLMKDELSDAPAKPKRMSSSNEVSKSKRGRPKKNSTATVL